MPRPYEGTCGRRGLAPALQKCLEAKPDLCLWIGDNVYADTKTSPDFIAECSATRDEVTYRVNFAELERHSTDPEGPLCGDAAAVGARALGPGRPVPTHAGHAHNDYWHERPIPGGWPASMAGWKTSTATTARQR